MVHGPSKGLELLRALDEDGRLASHYRLDAVRAHLLEMVGDYQSSIKHYRIAASRTTSIPEQNYLMTQAARIAEREPS
jgi:predicted RNA polymerase sigma factor